MCVHVCTLKKYLGHLKYLRTSDGYVFEENMVILSHGYIFEEKEPKPHVNHYKNRREKT